MSATLRFYIVLYWLFLPMFLLMPVFRILNFDCFLGLRIREFNTADFNCLVLSIKYVDHRLRTWLTHFSSELLVVVDRRI